VRRPTSMWTMKTIKATTNKRFISPPPTWVKRPNSHSKTNIAPTTINISTSLLTHISMAIMYAVSYEGSHSEDPAIKIY
jgi:hypothetical protein